MKEEVRREHQVVQDHVVHHECAEDCSLALWQQRVCECRVPSVISLQKKGELIKRVGKQSSLSVMG